MLLQNWLLITNLISLVSLVIITNLITTNHDWLIKLSIRESHVWCCIIIFMQNDFWGKGETEEHYAWNILAIKLVKRSLHLKVSVTDFHHQCLVCWILLYTNSFGTNFCFRQHENYSILTVLSNFCSFWELFPFRKSHPETGSVHTDSLDYHIPWPGQNTLPWKAELILSPLQKWTALVTLE